MRPEASADLVQLTDLLVEAAVFGLVLCVWIALVLIVMAVRSTRLRALRQRLGIAGGAAPGPGRRVIDLWHARGRATTTVPVGPQASAPSLGARRAPSRTRAVLLVLAPAAAAGAVTFLVSRNALLAAGVAIATIVIVRIAAGRHAARREALFERQFVDALELAARSLRAGHPLMGAFQLVTEEMADPVRTVFGEICQRHDLGGRVDEVLRAAADRAPCSDMRLLATSVAIQSRTGGNSATLMDRLASVIRDRIRLGRRAKILTAQTKLSMRILIVLPVVVFFLYNVLNPKYMAPFYTTTSGAILLGAAVLLLAVGAWTMNRMSVLKY